MQTFERPSPRRGVDTDGGLPGDRSVSGKRYWIAGGVIRRRFPKVRGKAAVKAAKRARRHQRERERIAA